MPKKQTAPQYSNSPYQSAELDARQSGKLIRRCRSSQWEEILHSIDQDPKLATTILTMDNHISTTILHQAINSKSNTQQRAHVIRTILHRHPTAAALRNGYGSLPIHVLCQRNTKMDSATKEDLIMELIRAYPESLLLPGGVGQRTPLHIIFTDYTSPSLVRTMIARAPEATSIRDKNGWLPIHVAASRHVSPEKLRMLLQAHPASLHEVTLPDQESVLFLAKSRATKSHPNYALIEELQKALSEHPTQNGSAPSGDTPVVLMEHRDDDSLVRRPDEATSANRNVTMVASNMHHRNQDYDTEPIADWRQPPVFQSFQGPTHNHEEMATSDPDTLANLLLHFRHGGDENGVQQVPAHSHETLSATQATVGTTDPNLPDGFDGEIAAV